MRIKRNVVAPLLVAAMGLGSGGWLLQRGVDPSQNVYFQARLLEEVVRHVSQRFVEETDPDRLYRMAIDGMLRELGDPHSAFMTPEDYADLRLQTQGEYGGLGIEIDVREGWLTVLSPLPNSPAERVGLMPGDRIVQVEDESTEGWSTDKAVSVLRGPRGSTVNILVRRVGVPEAIPFEVERADIELTAVPASYMLGGDVGYVELTVFSESATDSLRHALERLQERGARSVVLDMRRNSGGLLDQGMAVADLFLERRQLILETRGRSPEQNQVARARTGDQFPDLELAVLIGQRSASATEIVAGALQDHDRAVLIGATTFGKGSVQTLYELPGDNILKLTTARWFTPSGRSIQKPYGIGAEESLARLEAAAEAGEQGGVRAPGAAPEAEEKAEQNAPVFRTDAGREVLGGGGITPDLVVPDTLSAAEQELMLAVREDAAAYNSIRYRYAVEYAHQNPGLRPGFPVTRDMLDGFYEALREGGIELDREVYEDAASLVGQRLAYEISLARFNRAEAWKRLLEGDPQVDVAVDLLRGAESRDALFRQLAAYAERHGLTLGVAYRAEGAGAAPGLPTGHP